MNVLAFLLLLDVLPWVAGAAICAFAAWIIIDNPHGPSPTPKARLRLYFAAWIALGVASAAVAVVNVVAWLGFVE